MSFTDQLDKEHKLIKSMLVILEAVCRKEESPNNIDPNHLEDIVEFIKVFADKCHHGKEEELLFPALENAGIPRDGGPIGVMLQEHDIGSGFVQAMKKSAIQYKSGNKEAFTQFAENGRNYIELLRQHIEKEDKILYPMAEQVISSENQHMLLGKFNEVEREVLGIDKHEEFKGLIKSLEQTYLES